MLRLLGPPTIESETEDASILVSRTVLLPFYLACTQTWVRRDELAFFLRPDVDQETGRQYLRKLISNARKLSWTGGLEVEPHRVRWRTETDVERFRHAYGEGRWYEAVQLYRGPFIQGADIAQLPSFSAWLYNEREVLEHAWQSALLHYAADLESSGAHREAAAAAKQLLEHDAFHEDALQSFLRNAYFSGQRELALKTAETFAAQLQHEFDLEPTRPTQSLIKTIRSAGTLEKQTLVPRHGRRRSDTVSAAKSKQEQLAEVSELLTTPGTRLISLDSSSGPGTTMLIAKRVADPHVALLSVVELAAQLLRTNRRKRALELLLVVINHQDCNAQIRNEVEKVWPGLIRDPPDP